jgi:hypothetical protein
MADEWRAVVGRCYAQSVECYSTIAPKVVFPSRQGLWDDQVAWVAST